MYLYNFMCFYQFITLPLVLIVKMQVKIKFLWQHYSQGPNKSKHYDQVMPYGIINISQHWFRHRIVTYLAAPIHYLNQWWLLISVVLWHSPESNFTAIALEATILYNDIEDHTSIPEKPSWFIRHLSDMYAIQICEISHQTYGPSHWKFARWFSWTLLYTLKITATSLWGLWVYLLPIIRNQFQCNITKIHNFSFMKNQDAFQYFGCKMSAILSSPNELNFPKSWSFPGSTLSQCLFYKKLSVIPSTPAQW